MADYELNVPGTLLSSLLTEQNGLAKLVEVFLDGESFVDGSDDSKPESLWLCVIAAKYLLDTGHWDLLNAERASPSYRCRVALSFNFGGLAKCFPLGLITKLSVDFERGACQEGHEALLAVKAGESSQIGRIFETKVRQYLRQNGVSNCI